MSRFLFRVNADEEDFYYPEGLSVAKAACAVTIEIELFNPDAMR